MYFFIGWTLFVIRFDPGPGNFSLLIDHVHGRMRNAINPLSFVGGVAQSVSVNDFVFRIRENRKSNCALAIRGNFLSEVLAYIGRVDADGEQFRILIFLQKSPESG